VEEELLVDTAAAESDVQDVCEADDKCAGCVRGYAAEEEGDCAGYAGGGEVGGDWDGYSRYAYGQRGCDWCICCRSKDVGGSCRRGDDWNDGRGRDGGWGALGFGADGAKYLPEQQAC